LELEKVKFYENSGPC